MIVTRFAPSPTGLLHLGSAYAALFAWTKARAAEPFAWRLHLAAALRETGPLTRDPRPFGDVVIGRKHTPGRYPLCVTHDDALQGVSLVTRAVDLEAATAIHEVLQRLMGWPVPAYEFHRLLTNPDGTRLAKRDRSVGIRALREDGYSPARVRAMVGF